MTSHHTQAEGFLYVTMWASRCTRMYGWIHRSTWTTRGVESSVDAPTYHVDHAANLEYSYSWYHHPPGHTKSGSMDP